MKKIINHPQDVVMEMCKGIAYAHPELEFHTKYKVITRKNKNIDKVSLVSGGGSGHEPAHAGFVGKGMLDAAVCGDVFASPSQIQVYQAIKETTGKKGTLLIIKNYSGDIMNFKNAAYLAQEDGIDVEYVKVDDDIAVKDSLYTVGRRGVAGTVFVHKVAGAAAEEGKNLAEVKEVALKAICNVKSLGFAFSSCTVPAKGTPTFQLGEEEIEFGVGIHGEPGIKCEKIISADELAERTVAELVKELDLQKNEEAAVLINGFGSTPLQELYLLNHSVQNQLFELNIRTPFVLVGNYMTSIDMAGASVSIMKLDEELKHLLMADCNTPALKNINVIENQGVNFKDSSSQITKEFNYEIEVDPKFAIVNNDRITLENMIYMVDCMSACIIKNEISFCELDSFAGDGDFGMSVAKGFRQLKQEWESILKEQSQDIGTFLNACSLIIMEHCGGASGPIWGSAFRAAAKYAGAQKELDINTFAGMMQASVKGIQATGERSFGRGAIVGDKTLIDALVPSANCLSVCGKSETNLENSLTRAAQAAVLGAMETEKIVARMGRAGTVGERSIGHPDAGAYGLGVIFTDVVQHLIFK
ncbi:dihydroxyacetone kinase subunit DhaK [Lachnotalea glycerini]|uniref:phosphoenolpyruvate--glycerone phosphotransferase n=1 Tax=Lachnotalea glycerini TaxID=1763509 RepID=A0A371JBF8_9FIRM|nr:dihydroxyacetone kinase subunit DhaK [Lachnotalea glycerini]RDY30090.1 dihydroxyacetone kinase subunit DhaK [Lachnotalea glycerini]